MNDKKERRKKIYKGENRVEEVKQAIPRSSVTQTVSRQGYVNSIVFRESF